ncbi:MAG: alpha-ribazole phosphatase [Methylococcales bacterium]
MDIYLIRHTKTDTEKGLCFGQSNVALSHNFADDALQLQKKMPELKSDCLVFSSPLTRCLQLAEKLSDKVSTDARLLELDFGDWENRYFNDVDNIALKQWSDNFVEVRPPNGESFSDLYRRAGGFWRELLALESEQVVVVTHAGVIRALLAHVLNLPLANTFQFRIDLGSVHKLQHIDHCTFINCLNR